MSSLPIADLVEGSLLATAYGDALGIPFECKTFDDLKDLPRQSKTFTEVKNHPFVPEPWAPGRWTDDTQLTLALMHGVDPSTGEYLESRMVQEHIRQLHISGAGWGIGTRNAVLALGRGVPLTQSGNPSGTGNGVLMKLAPLAIYDWYCCGGGAVGGYQSVAKCRVERLACMTHNN
eukprot:PhF_6_TR33001/c0_g1_i1/m.48626